MSGTKPKPVPPMTPNPMNSEEENKDLLISELLARVQALEVKAAMPELEGGTPRAQFISFMKRAKGKTSAEAEVLFLTMYNDADAEAKPRLLGWRNLHHQLHTLYGGWELPEAAISEETLFREDLSSTSVQVMDWVLKWTQLNRAKNVQTPRPRGSRGGKKQRPRQAAATSTTTSVEVKKEKK